MSQESQGPLAGITVLDLTRALAGPFASLMLAGLGARVIRIEEPKGDGREAAPFYGKDGVALQRRHGDDVSIAHLLRHRGKESITLNLKSPEARKVFLDLVPHVDVVIENYTRGTAERLGVGYSQARSVRADIVYCSISGFGQEGNPGGGKAMDGVIQALGGIMMTSGNEGDPPVRIGVPFADLNTPLFAVIGIVSALLHKERTGEGQYVDVSMLGVMSALQAAEPFKVLENLGIPMRSGSTVPRLAPFGVFPTRDGYVAVCSAGDKNFRALVQAMGRPELATDPRFVTQATRLIHSSLLDAEVEAWTKQFTRAGLVAALDAVGVAGAEVRTPDEANHDERVLARHEVERLPHPVHGATAEVFVPGVPIRFSRTDARLPPRSAGLGEHNRGVYGGMLEYDDAELQRLRQTGVI